MSQPVCVLCQYYHPHADTHPPDVGIGKRICEDGLRRLEHELHGLRAGYLRLREQLPAEPGAADQISQQLPAAAVPGASNQPIVTGSRDRRLVIDTDAVDLTAAAQRGSVVDAHCDQVGLLSVATVLNEWVGYWHQRWYTGETRPVAEPLALLDWIGTIRLRLIADQDPAIVDFADELRALRAALRHVLGETAPKPVPMWGVPCPRCKLVSQLMLDPDDPDHYRECASCGRLLNRADYLQHLRDLVDEYRTDQEVARG